MQVVECSEIEEQQQQYGSKDEVASVRPGGTVYQRLISDDASDGLNFRCLRSQFQPGEKAYATPRHQHPFQQLRWAESGDLNYAPGKDIPEGDVAYFPRGVWYGPQMKDSGISVAVQWGFEGEMQSGSEWTKHRAEAQRRLEERGRFEEGVFIEVDPESGETRETDAVQALFETQYEVKTGKKFVAPAAGYEEPILMHPDSFQYFPDGDGVSLKILGKFYDQPGPRGDSQVLRIELQQWSSFSLAEDRAQLFWSRTSGLQIADMQYAERTFVYSPLGEESEISAADQLVIDLLVFPRRD